MKKGEVMAEKPLHVAFIMDGNGRWAKERGLPRLEGHRRGVNTVRDLVSGAKDLGIGTLTFYAFSTENWKRPEDEVSGIMSLLKQHFKKEMKTFSEKGVRIRIFGDTSLQSKLSEDIIEVIKETEAGTSENIELNVNFCINYGGRDEIIRAAQSFADDVEKGSRYVGDLDEELFEAYLDSRKQFSPDIIVRTGGDMRISNFLLWQMAYSELVFVENYWPDFCLNDVKEIVEDFTRVERRFGTV